MFTWGVLRFLQETPYKEWNKCNVALGRRGEAVGTRSGSFMGPWPSSWWGWFGPGGGRRAGVTARGARRRQWGRRSTVVAQAHVAGADSSFYRQCEGGDAGSKAGKLAGALGTTRQGAWQRCGEGASLLAHHGSRAQGFPAAWRSWTGRSGVWDGAAPLVGGRSGRPFWRG